MNAGRFVDGAPDDWRRLGRAIAARRHELGMTQADAVAAAKAAGYAMSAATWLLLEKGGRLRIRFSTAAAVCWALGWTSNSVEAVLAGGEPTIKPLARVSGRPGIDFILESSPDPDALRSGHGGSEGWPPWLEAKFRRVEEDVAEHGQLIRRLLQEVAQLRAVVGDERAGP